MELYGTSFISDLLERDIPLPEEEALSILAEESVNLYELISIADRVRQKHFGSRVHACAILNAKIGGCSENCRFCSQSAHFEGGVESGGWVPVKNVTEAARRMKMSGAEHFGVVTAIRGLQKGKQLDRVLAYGKTIQEEGLSFHASLGILDEPEIDLLKKNGLEMLNHNLETSRNFFPKTCTSHGYDDRVRTVQLAREKGIRVCCGGIIGIGETLDDRVSLAAELKKLDVDVVPLNFLNPQPGTPLKDSEKISPLTALKTLSIFRLMLPDKDIKMAGGREVVLRTLQPLIFPAGATSIIIGDYLTTQGNPTQADMDIISDLGLIP